MLFDFSAAPLRPTNVEIFGIDSDELSVRWNPSEDADSFQIQEYVVRHRKFEEKLHTSAYQPASDDKTQYTIRIQSLEPETTYMIQVGAKNKYDSNYNDESAHKTDAARKPVLFHFFFFFRIFIYFFRWLGSLESSKPQCCSWLRLEKLLYFSRALQFSSHVLEQDITKSIREKRKIRKKQKQDGMDYISLLHL